jgi:peptidoglycan/LPS O-acetylase OafA/YrhL
VLLGVVGSAYLALALLTWLGGRRPRTGVALLTGLLDAGLVMLLLAGSPHPARAFCGLAVVLGSLAGLVLAYQPGVERYLGPEEGSAPADERAAVMDAT